MRVSCYEYSVVHRLRFLFVVRISKDLLHGWALEQQTSFSRTFKISQ